MTAPGGKVLALCGGVGGAKLAFGLNAVLGAQLTVVVNTGDDFEHLGLFVCPDIDTVLYTLSGRANRELGWGRQDESWSFMAAMAELGGPIWFRLGDRDLALHVERTRRRREGQDLTRIVADIAQRWGIPAQILPMSDQIAATMVETDEGVLSFQDYFVRRQCQPRVRSISFEREEGARVGPAALAALKDAALGAIIICPSNPYLSIDPILTLPGMADTLRAASCPVVAISPLIGGKAVKGPTAKMMAELNLSVTNRTIAAHYAGVIDALVIDASDRADSDLGLPVLVTDTLMKNDDDRIRLATETLDFARRLEPGRGRP